jgi:hypothetical protein
MVDKQSKKQTNKEADLALVRRAKKEIIELLTFWF